MRLLQSQALEKGSKLAIEQIGGGNGRLEPLALGFVPHFQIGQVVLSVNELRNVGVRESLDDVGVGHPGRQSDTGYPCRARASRIIETGVSARAVLYDRVAQGQPHAPSDEIVEVVVETVRI